MSMYCHSSFFPGSIKARLFIFPDKLISPMLRFILYSFLLTASLSAANSQSLYMPRNIGQAFKKGTRSPDGRPGSNYWQNTGHYTINVSAAPPDRTVKGSEQITYFNNSPDTLRNIVIKLILNIHKPGAVRYGAAGPDYHTPGVQIDAYTEN